MIEEWRNIKDYEGFYQVSNLGRVRSLDRVIKNRFFKGKILTILTDRYGYSFVRLWNSGNSKNISVHRLVADAFIPNPNNLPHLNHKDEIKSNNIVSNLEWCTIKYNNNYGTKKERCAKKRIGMKMPKNSVEIIASKHKKKIGVFKDGKLIKVYDSAADANRENPNYNYISISSCCNGRIKTYRGYEWKFLNN